MVTQQIKIERVFQGNNSPDFEGIRITVQNGSNIYTFNAGYSIEEEYMDDPDSGFYASPITSRYGRSSPILKNGKYYLPWHVAAALGNNGEGESWIESASAEDAVKVLQDLKREYMEDFSACVAKANAMCGTYVY